MSTCAPWGVAQRHRTGVSPRPIFEFFPAVENSCEFGLHSLKSSRIGGDVITGLPASPPEHLKVFHAGTTLDDGNVVTSGGRVLCAVALGDTTAEAQAEAYELVSQINWSDVYYRTDIGYRAVARERA